MALKIVSLDIKFRYKPRTSDTLFTYTPIGRDEQGREQKLDAYRGKIELSRELIPEALREKLERLTVYVADAVAGRTPEVELHGQLIRGTPTVNMYNVRQGSTISVEYAIQPVGSLSAVELDANELTDAGRRLLQNVLPTYEQLAWDDLRRRVNVPGIRDTRKKVLISYRKTRPKYKLFAEAIGHRLGREGFLPWLDEWDVRAGDSLPREIAGGFKDVYGVIIVLTADYPGGKWAREELETAITKRVEQGLKVIPIKFEPCEPPELLRSLVYVDCTNHEDGQIELQFRRIIDALNEIELNPYR